MRRSGLVGLVIVGLAVSVAADDGGATAAVRRFYAFHFAHDMAFTRAEVERRAGFLTPGLLARCAEYFATPQSADEVPEIDGDPFTDSQDYPESYDVGEARQQGDSARVDVTFAMKGGDRWRVQAVVVKAGDGWKIDDIETEQGPSLRALLRRGSIVSPRALPPALAGYREWRPLTPDPVAVPLARWVLCRMPTPKEVSDARTAHGEHADRYIRVFVNGLAVAHFRDAVGRLPEGAVVVKEKLEQSSDADPVAVAGMVKRSPGFAPAFGDWEFLYVDRERPEVPASSPALQAHCGSCHRARRDDDFLFRSYQ